MEAPSVEAPSNGLSADHRQAVAPHSDFWHARQSDRGHEHATGRRSRVHGARFEADEGKSQELDSAVAKATKGLRERVAALEAQLRAWGIEPCKEGVTATEAAAKAAAQRKAAEQRDKEQARKDSATGERQRAGADEAAGQAGAQAPAAGAAGAASHPASK